MIDRQQLVYDAGESFLAQDRRPTPVNERTSTVFEEQHPAFQGQIPHRTRRVMGAVQLYRGRANWYKLDGTLVTRDEDPTTINYLLTAKQNRFSEEYVKDLDAKRAYTASGYKCRPQELGRNAYRLLRVPAVQARIEFLQELIRKENELSAISVIESFHRIARDSESDGNKMAALRALENLAKILGLFVERQEIKQQTTVTPQPESALDRELRRLLTTLTKST